MQDRISITIAKNENYNSLIKIKLIIDYLINNEIDFDKEIPIEIINDLSLLHSDLIDFQNGKKLRKRKIVWEN
jgi:hypothetical protein